MLDKIVKIASLQTVFVLHSINLLCTVELVHNNEMRHFYKSLSTPGQLFPISRFTLPSLSVTLSEVLTAAGFWWLMQRPKKFWSLRESGTDGNKNLRPMHCPLHHHKHVIARVSSMFTDASVAMVFLQTDWTQ